MLKMAGLGLHFLLELAALAALAVWGFSVGQNVVTDLLLGIGVPLAAAALWGIFRVPNDPGPATVAIPGVWRLILEWAIFSLAILALLNSGHDGWAWTFGLLALLDYAIQYERVNRLLAG